MTMPVYQALFALKAAVATIDPAPQLPLRGVWVYPWEYKDINLTKLPVAIAGKVVNVVDRRGVKVTGTDRRDWRAEILIPLAPGQLRFPNAASAAVEERQEEYIDAVEAVLFADMTLNGTADVIGTTDALGYKLFDVMTTHWYWEEKPYWTVRFVVPIAQFVNQVMGPQ